jgi:hypothetical protein
MTQQKYPHTFGGYKNSVENGLGNQVVWYIDKSLQNIDYSIFYKVTLHEQQSIVIFS